MLGISVLVFKKLNFKDDLKIRGTALKNAYHIIGDNIKIMPTLFCDHSIKMMPTIIIG